MATALNVYNIGDVVGSAAAFLNEVFSIPSDFKEELAMLIVKHCEKAYWNKERPTDDAERRCLAFEYGSIDVKFLAMCAEMGIVNVLRAARIQYPYDFYLHINPDGVRVTYKWGNSPKDVDVVWLFPNNKWPEYRDVQSTKEREHKEYVEARREAAQTGSELTVSSATANTEADADAHRIQSNAYLESIVKHYCRHADITPDTTFPKYMVAISRSTALIGFHSNRLVSKGLNCKEYYDPNVIAEVGTTFLLKTFALAADVRPGLHKALIRHCEPNWNVRDPAYGSDKRRFRFLFGLIDEKLLSILTPLGVTENVMKARQLFPYDFSLHLDPDYCALKVSFGEDESASEELYLFPGDPDSYMKGIKKHLRHFREHIKLRQSMASLAQCSKEEPV